MSSSCCLTLGFLLTPVQLSIPPWTGEQFQHCWLPPVEGLPLSHPLSALPSVMGFYLPDEKSSPQSECSGSLQEANGRAGKERVTGFSIGSISANFHWDKGSCSSSKIHCIWTSSVEGGFLSVVWQERHGLEKINDEAIESSELFLQSAKFSITIVGR